MRSVARLVAGLCLVGSIGERTHASLFHLLPPTPHPAGFIGGSWTATGERLPYSNIYVGYGDVLGSARREPQRGYVNYDLSIVRHSTPANWEVVEAVLQFALYSPPADNETLGVFDVATPVDKLEETNVIDPAIYDDLGSGAIFGWTGISPQAQYVAVPFNADALRAINANLNGSITFGLSIVTLSPTLIADELVAPRTVPALYLRVEAVPEPSGSAMLAVAAGGVATSVRRRGVDR